MVARPAPGIAPGGMANEPSDIVRGVISRGNNPNAELNGSFDI